LCASPPSVARLRVERRGVGRAHWGGIGTVSGGAVGALTVSFIQTGIVGAGLSGFYVQFFNGLIIILSLLGHRWNQSRYR
jgi:ribose/xylose/arabinose/galactoside ABC-type transport system permease subunit